MTVDLGIVGATGVTGEVTLRILRERGFPVGELRLFASRRSAGRKIAFGDREVTVEALDDGNFAGLDLVISATSAALAREWVPRIVEAGPIVIDQSSAFRHEPGVPLVVPEINADALREHTGIVAGPNCTTAVAVMAVAPLHREVGIRSVISSSYQSISGTGRDAILEFLDQTRKATDQVEALRGREPLDVPEPQVFPKVTAFNLFPHCETFREGEDTSTEEEKMEAEMRKIFGAPDLVCHATAVRVPVLVSHSVSLALELAHEVSSSRARELIGAFPGLRLVDEPWSGRYPTPLDAAGIDEILVGRIRANPLLGHGISLFASGDNLRKGNALNAIQVAELLVG